MDADMAVLLWVQRHTTSSTIAVARGLSLAGEHAGLWVVAGALGSVLDRPRRDQWVRATAAVLVAHASSVVVKRVARRVRPEHEDLLVHVGVPSRWSFPSSHATSTTTAAVVLAPLLGGWTGLLVPAMAWSRLALGVHYPSDVATGAVLGGFVGAVGEGLRRRAGAAR